MVKHNISYRQLLSETVENWGPQNATNHRLHTKNKKSVPEYTEIQFISILSCKHQAAHTVIVKATVIAYFFQLAKPLGGELAITIILALLDYLYSYIFERQQH